MTTEEFKVQLDEILDPDKVKAITPDSPRKILLRCPTCDCDHEETTVNYRASCLLVRFINGEHGGNLADKDNLLGRLRRLNAACLHIPTHSQADDELMGQASKILSRLAELCSSFEEFRSILETCDYRLLDTGSACTIQIKSLLRIGKRIGSE